MDGPAHAALVRLSHSLGDEIDETVLEYLCSVLQPDEELDSSLEDVVELLAGACPAFGSLPAEEQTQRMLALLDEVANAAAAPSSGAAVQEQAYLPAALSSSSSSSSAELVAAQLAQLSCSLDPKQELAKGDNGGREAGTSSSSTSPPMQPEVQELLALCPPGISFTFMLHVLRDLNNCDPQAAADWILDCSDICRREQAWLERRKDQELDKERQKQAILERFDLQAVPADGSRRDKALDNWGRDKKQKQQGPQVRYRDGQCHHTKDKYVVEKVREDWNGGSTGKVYTKGKRGKGFV